MDTNGKIKNLESSAPEDSEKGSCMEAPQIGATRQDPVEQEVGETPLIGGERAPSSSDEPRWRPVVRMQSMTL